MLPQNNMAHSRPPDDRPLGRVPGGGFRHLASSEAGLQSLGESAPAPQCWDGYGPAGSPSHGHLGGADRDHAS